MYSFNTNGTRGRQAEDGRRGEAGGRGVGRGEWEKNRKKTRT